MKKEFEKARKAVESLFWDTCYVQIFQEEETDWGEILHQKEEVQEGFPCRLTAKAKNCGQNGLLAELEQAVLLLYPVDREIPAGSAVWIRKENGEERQYYAAGESQVFLTHKAVGLRRRTAA